MKLLDKLVQDFIQRAMATGNKETRTKILEKALDLDAKEAAVAAKPKITPDMEFGAISEAPLTRVNQENAARLWERLGDLGRPTLYRSDIPSSVRKLLNRGFDEKVQMRDKSHLSGWGEASGIYYAKDEDDLASLLSGTPKPPERSADFEARPLPKARIGYFTEREWDERFLHKPPHKITKELKEHFDFVVTPDVIQGNINPATGERFQQVVQINPKKALVKTRPGGYKYGMNKPVYRILGLGGAATGAALTAQAILPDESDAALLQQFGKAAKTIGRQMKKALPSSSEHDLIGRTLPAFGEDATIAEVKNLGGDRRAIRFEDGRVFSAQRHDLENLAKTFGTEDRLNVFREAAEENKIDMALRSLKYHEDHTKFHQLRTKGSIKTQQDEHRAYVEEWIQNTARYSDSPALEKQALVKNLSTGRQYLILEDYALILERMGLVKINQTATKQIRELAIGTQQKWKK